MDDYPYAGLDFRGDPDLALSSNVAWGEIGKNFLFYDFLDFSNIMIHFEKYF